MAAEKLFCLWSHNKVQNLMCVPSIFGHNSVKNAYKIDPFFDIRYSNSSFTSSSCMLKKSYFVSIFTELRPNNDKSYYKVTDFYVLSLNKK